MGLRVLVNIVFSLGLFINAMLFIPQAIRIVKKQEAEDLSLITFIGFWITQLAAIIYGYINQDYILMFGYILAAITCGVVTGLIVYYRFKGNGNAREKEEIYV